jgi:hypothetical protein
MPDRAINPIFCATGFGSFQLDELNLYCLIDPHTRPTVLFSNLSSPVK